MSESEFLHLIHIGAVLEFPVRHQLENFPHAGDLFQQGRVGAEVQSYSSQGKSVRYRKPKLDDMLGNKLHGV